MWMGNAFWPRLVWGWWDTYFSAEKYVSPFSSQYALLAYAIRAGALHYDLACNVSPRSPS